MKSTPEQTAKRRRLKQISEYLAVLAHEQIKNIPAHAVFRRANEQHEDGVIDYDEYYTFSHRSTTLPASKTGGVVYLKCRRRVLRGKLCLWLVWEPGYAATKPESVDELLPLIAADAKRLREGQPDGAGQPDGGGP